MTVELETQRRGQAFRQALQQLEQEYNCTMTAVPKWEPSTCGTWVLGFDKQVMVGPAPRPAPGPIPGPAPKEPEEGADA